MDPIYGVSDPTWETYRRPGTGTGLQINTTDQPIVVNGVAIPPGYFVPEAGSPMAWATQTSIARSFGLPVYEPEATSQFDFYDGFRDNFNDRGGLPTDVPTVTPDAPWLGGQPPASGGGSGGGGTGAPPPISWQPQPGSPPPQWNWDDFRPGAPSMDGGGGYNPDDFAFERYVPGQESPWGVPEVQGGNKDFYRNQFMNLLSQEQGFQSKQRAAALRRQEAEANPQQAPAMDWSWLEGGLPEVTVMDNGYASPLQGLQFRPQNSAPAVPNYNGYAQGGGYMP
jgi:hypothetical protein